jgi:hypothetical protein
VTAGRGEVTAGRAPVSGINELLPG